MHNGPHNIDPSDWLYKNGMLMENETLAHVVLKIFLIFFIVNKFKWVRRNSKIIASSWNKHDLLFNEQRTT